MLPSALQYEVGLGFTHLHVPCHDEALPTPIKLIRRPRASEFEPLDFRRRWAWIQRTFNQIRVAFHGSVTLMELGTGWRLHATAWCQRYKVSFIRPDCRLLASAVSSCVKFSLQCLPLHRNLHYFLYFFTWRYYQPLPSHTQ